MVGFLFKSVIKANYFIIGSAILLGYRGQFWCEFPKL